RGLHREGPGAIRRDDDRGEEDGEEEPESAFDPGLHDQPQSRVLSTPTRSSLHTRDTTTSEEISAESSTTRAAVAYVDGAIARGRGNGSDGARASTSAASSRPRTSPRGIAASVTNPSSPSRTVAASAWVKPRTRMVASSLARSESVVRALLKTTLKAMITAK